MPKPLDAGRLKQFENRPAIPNIGSTPTDRVEVNTERWPSREAVRDGQVSIKAPLRVIDRFKRLCKNDRRTYADMLGILMDIYESKR